MKRLLNKKRNFFCFLLSMGVRTSKQKIKSQILIHQEIPLCPSSPALSYMNVPLKILLFRRINIPSVDKESKKKPPI